MNLIKKYNLAQEEIKELNISIKDKIITGITAFLISGLIVSGTLCLSINLVIFRYFLPLLILFIATLIIIFAILFDFFYLKGITKGQNKNIKYIVLANSIGMSIAIYLLTIIAIIIFL